MQKNRPPGKKPIAKCRHCGQLVITLNRRMLYCTNRCRTAACRVRKNVAATRRRGRKLPPVARRKAVPRA